MHSTKTLLIAVAVIAAVAFATGFLLRDDGKDVDSATPTPVPSTSATQTPQISAAARTPVIHTVRLTAAGPVPAQLVITAGDGVQFINDSDTAFWVASDPHPTHDQCPGFDARRALGRGEKYGLTFPTARTCSYHNHLDPLNAAFRGTVTVR